MRSHLHLLRKMTWLSDKRRFTLFPPFFLMRVRVLELADDWSNVRVCLPLNWLSANAAGNMFGGYQASLADPVPALACLKRFPGYRIATKKLDIDFIRVGNSDLILHFNFDADLAASIAQDLADKGRSTPCFTMHFVRDDGEICTIIKNTVAIRPAGYIGHHE